MDSYLAEIDTPKWSQINVEDLYLDPVGSGSFWFRFWILED
jgi:hypothetical protein